VLRSLLIVAMLLCFQATATACPRRPLRRAAVAIVRAPVRAVRMAKPLRRAVKGVGRLLCPRR